VVRLVNHLTPTIEYNLSTLRDNTLTFNQQIFNTHQPIKPLEKALLKFDFVSNRIRLDATFDGSYSAVFGA